MNEYRNRSQLGVGHLVVLLACLVIIVIFAAGWTVSRQQPGGDSAARDLPEARLQTKTDQDPKAESKAEGKWVTPGGPDARWSYEGGTPPKCPERVLAFSPADMSKATDIGLPGQYRGTHFKAHGGIRFDGSKPTDIPVKLPMDAKLVHVKRYIESGELQYLVDFEHACGFRVRYDHLAVLSGELMKIAATTPEPSDDTRSLPMPHLFGQKFKAGTTVATAIGFPKANNIGFDFGVYDLRQVNEISKNAQWAALHSNESEMTFYGVCWLPMLPAPHAAKLKSLYGTNPTIKYVSDYCTDAPDGGTLQYNDGRP